MQFGAETQDVNCYGTLP